ncbi:MAG TPA: glycerol-3-phosphate dehydrogenase/oxidase [Planctomycetes bacterium]|nr:glycerol-3-phosphate dehydrogenase/oxidase [Planctomycetota bacterium]
MPKPKPNPPRTERFSKLEEQTFDALVLGGGITGAGIALDLVARGLEVALIERGDWASATSSASSRLVHGGLRYLEQFEFHLVRTSCLERALLLENAAGLVWPERFTFPIHETSPVPKWKLRAGLLLYTAVSIPRILGWPRSLDPAAVRRAIPGVRGEGLVGGGSYLDGATDDARLTLAVVRTAMQRGAVALSWTEAVGVERGSEETEVRLIDRIEGREFSARARRIVLAGGPGTDALRGMCGLTGSTWIQPTRGSHITVPRERLPTDGAVILHSAVDGRVLFLIPWPRYTVIGTTDIDADPAQPPRATAAEVGYLLDSANALVPDAALTRSDVVATWAGLRPLLAANKRDPSARSREERIALEGPFLTIAGGKLTAYRAMAEEVGARLAQDLGRGDRTRHSPTRDLRLVGALGERSIRPLWSHLTTAGLPAGWDLEEDGITEVWERRYGSLRGAVGRLVSDTPRGMERLDPATRLGEVRWAIEHEDALGLRDVLFRRTDAGFEPLETALSSAERIADEMARLLTWDGERRDRELAEARAELHARQAWRGERTTPSR